MASVQPVARPQSLMTDSDSAEQDIDLFSNSSNSEPSSITFPEYPGRQFQRTVPQSIPSSANRKTVLPPIEVGQIGGTDRRTANRLKKGRMRIDARLDLHGYTEEQAYTQLLGFLNAARNSGARCVLIVTGKGGRGKTGIGKLKLIVPKWLNEAAFRPSVLSVTYAQQRDGGNGALYVLLRKGERTTSKNKLGDLR
ncbi:MAG: Smr/MutS family protein [Rhodospirillaceae bacterium]|nr:Smr/MutS family protein [Rhodospirillaceae bacterium]